ncbi:MAG TPA: peptide-methionine (S)-S-oxide reductase MsrA [Brevefilum fermentans]|jgi:peptide-methionine (S)-S-oxide reductase|uniref:Peptide methionine sulfoxide reductase MsrA n=1 Tax=Candidatus Brevifilum fermentans TaxID=1986204 RepID=A0A1Y6K5I2_9CHLR|nr:peptide-methionine (S)-S-oxide reductase MsrA [Brevefilum fermentans]MDI9566856.1 peptide-methionine (S)-S-oxide reductase MsrA [Chloroflexota bacterium]OQB82887.1 MAG: Peptide methionine sulfoxide reductase MsrA 3 [Chloroflexi bacterium ADurb.Bin120]SMX54894.1 Peptide methionine sulfoxide reductase MsrA [Brevefilum fermentans]HOM67397.1 peptide-methionine (S)-S-oxide reductase MsrA [Brevefilum fermentans]HPX94942.1 peptide-methionine (S)-S-oxide reductase MsrA [Brevefilum fermentans]
MTEKIATFAAGCFWGVEASFSKIAGVLDTVVGYTGGTFPNPSYQMVCTGNTGHAEAVQVTFDPQKITYTDLVKAFFDLHDPTTRNRQGPDVGSQYRSVIFYHDPEQQKIAEQVKSELDASGKYRYSIVTQIVPAGEFYRAEEYHQQYYAKHILRRC